MAVMAKRQTIALIATLFAILCLALLFLYRYQAENTKAATAAPKSATEPAGKSAASKSVPGQSQAAVPKEQSVLSALTEKLASPPPAADASNSVPAFDVARVEPSGEAVIAGRAPPGTTVELLRNGEVHDRVVVDPSGQFAMVPPRLPSGSYELTLRATRPDGTQTTSKQSVAVVLEAKPTSREAPVVALITPDKPTVVLSQPAAPTSATPTVVVEAADIEPDGKLHVSGRAAAGAAVRFYLNDTFVAAVTAAADGRFSITVNEGVVPGNYRIRLDQVEPGSGSVLARAEVPLNVPVATASRPSPAAPAKQAEVRQTDAKQAEVKQAEVKQAEVKQPDVKQPEVAAAQPPPASTPPSSVVAGKPAASSAPASAVATPPAAPSTATSPSAAPSPAITAQQPPAADATPPRGSTPSAVVVPKIETAKVVRGDNLWNISRDTYGAGVRYAVIYRANRDQIRNPNLIYPGQIFVLPAR